MALSRQNICDKISEILGEKVTLSDSDPIYPDYLSSLQAAELLLTLDGSNYKLAKLGIHNLTINTILNV